MTGQGGPVLYRLDGRVHRAARFMSKHHDQRRLEHRHGIFQAGDHFVTGEIAGDAANKQVATGRIEAKFGSNAGIGATQYRRKGILARAQRLALVREVVPEGGAFDVAAVALRQTIERGIRGDDILRLRRCLSFAAIAGRVINPVASADAVNVRALRRVRRSP
jgi:hypothetical protein